MLRLGLTGGIASGKSAVARMLREMGFNVLDADGLGHTLMEAGTPGYGAIVREFGAGVTGAEGRIDRKKLGAMVFADRGKLERLNGILHPRVEEEMVRQFREWEKSGVPDAVSLLQSAIQSRKESGPLYLALAGYYRKNGDAKKAADAETKGKTLLNTNLPQAPASK